jgi:hypothetical protein
MNYSLVSEKGMLEAFARQINKIQEGNHEPVYDFEKAISACVGKFGKKCTDKRKTLLNNGTGCHVLNVKGAMDFVVPVSVKERSTDFFCKRVFQRKTDATNVYLQIAEKFRNQKPSLSRRRKNDSRATNLPPSKRVKGAPKGRSYFPEDTLPSLDQGIPNAEAFSKIVEEKEAGVFVKKKINVRMILVTAFID